jgi:hypothetical protein
VCTTFHPRGTDTIERRATCHTVNSNLCRQPSTDRLLR